MKNNLLRHLLALGILAVLLFIFSLGRQDLHTVQFWNRIFGDAAFVLLALSLMLGPLAKRFPRWQTLLPLRRELGLAFAAAALVHILILTKFFNWNFFDLFIHQHGSRTYVNHGVSSAGNWVGLVAIIYTLLLSLTSNKYSQQKLGSGWKFLQQQSYTLFILVVLHTFIFIYMWIKEGLWLFKPVFWSFTILTISLQIYGYILSITPKTKK